MPLSEGLQPLPDRPAPTAFPEALRDLLTALGAPVPPPGALWQGDARAAVRTALAGVTPPAPEALYEPLLRAAVLDPDPSFNRWFAGPACTLYGHRRVKTDLIEVLRNGTNEEKAGAARAWYWTRIPLTYVNFSPTPTPESQAAYDAVRDLEREWQDAMLAEFVRNDDLDVRRCLLPGLSLCERADGPPERRALVAAAVRIAREHPDEYLRHRVEVQLGDCAKREAT